MKGKMASGKIKTVVRFVLISMAVVCLSGAAAQNIEDQLPLCWQNIGNCLTKNTAQINALNGTSSPMEIRQALCCTLFVQETQTDTQCFCNVSTILPQLLAQEPNFISSLNTILGICGVPQSFQTICPNLGLTPTPSGSPPGSSPTDTTGMPPSILGSSPTDTTATPPTTLGSSPPMLDTKKTSGLFSLFGSSDKNASPTPPGKEDQSKSTQTNAANSISDSLPSLVFLLAGWMFY